MDRQERIDAQKKKSKGVKKESAKVMTSARIQNNANRDLSSNALEEVTLLKDHGNDKKGSKLLRHPKTADMLVNKGIAKF